MYTDKYEYYSVLFMQGYDMGSNGRDCFTIGNKSYRFTSDYEYVCSYALRNVNGLLDHLVINSLYYTLYCR